MTSLDVHILHLLYSQVTQVTQNCDSTFCRQLHLLCLQETQVHIMSTASTVMFSGNPGSLKIMTAHHVDSFTCCVYRKPRFTSCRQLHLLCLQETQVHIVWTVSPFVFTGNPGSHVDSFTYCIYRKPRFTSCGQFHLLYLQETQVHIVWTVSPVVFTGNPGSHHVHSFTCCIYRKPRFTCWQFHMMYLQETQVHIMSTASPVVFTGNPGSHHVDSFTCCIYRKPRFTSYRQLQLLYLQEIQVHSKSWQHIMSTASPFVFTGKPGSLMECCILQVRAFHASLTQEIF